MPQLYRISLTFCKASILTEQMGSSITKALTSLNLNEKMTDIFFVYIRFYYVNTVTN